MNKIFGIGWPKTGTTTLGKSLQALELGAYAGWSKGSHLFKAWCNNEHQKVLDFAKKYTIFIDLPWNVLDFYKELDSFFPNSKFILTERDSKRWFTSLRAWLTPPHRIKSNTRYRPYGELYHKVVFENKEFSIENHEEHYKKLYLKRNQEIKNYFQNRENLLVVSWEKGDGWKEICSFLNTPIPNKPFPHLNRNPRK